MKGVIVGIQKLECQAEELFVYVNEVCYFDYLIFMVVEDLKFTTFDKRLYSVTEIPYISS